MCAHTCVRTYEHAVARSSFCSSRLSEKAQSKTYKAQPGIFRRQTRSTRANEIYRTSLSPRGEIPFRKVCQNASVDRPMTRFAVRFSRREPSQPRESSRPRRFVTIVGNGIRNRLISRDTERLYFDPAIMVKPIELQRIWRNVINRMMHGNVIKARVRANKCRTFTCLIL